MYVLVRYILCLIALSPALIYDSRSLNAETKVGQIATSLIDVAYHPFANKTDTESKHSASCISTVVFSLRRLGFNCAYKDFKVYQQYFKSQSSLLKVGYTKSNKKGLILFNNSHFAIYYKDENSDGRIDVDDLIIHARFHPVKITKIKEWLIHDPIRPIRVVDLTKNILCPN